MSNSEVIHWWQVCGRAFYCYRCSSCILSRHRFLWHFFDSVTCKMLVPGCSNINNELEPMKSQKMEPRIDGSHAGFGGGVGCYEGNRIYVCRNIETGEVDGRWKREKGLRVGGVIETIWVGGCVVIVSGWWSMQYSDNHEGRRRMRGKN